MKLLEGTTKAGVAGLRGPQEAKRREYLPLGTVAEGVS